MPIKKDNKELDFTPLLKTMVAMREVKTDGKEAKENEHSMKDSKGKKIIYYMTKKMLKSLGLDNSRR